ncbi:MAG: MarR family winged helix-turn-helix transcriptional regulator [Pigmentiphaga sp.]|nr:MarR family winged helix-turn-helix transcriptional regulator [Pigmentiphaga sp.]
MTTMRTPKEAPAPWQDPLEQLEASADLPLELYLTFRVNLLSNVFERQWSRFLRESAGVSLSEWRIIAMLQNGPSTFARLVEATDVNKGLLHRSARSLEELGIITIGATPGDARSTTLTLTKAGRQLLNRVRPLTLERQRHFLSVLEPQERQALYAAVDKLREAAAQWDAILEAKAKPPAR